MYFLVIETQENKQQASEFVARHKGQMGVTTLLRMTNRQLSDIDLTNVVKSYGINYIPVMHLAFGASERKHYGEIEMSLRLMFGNHFIGRSRKSRHS